MTTLQHTTKILSKLNEQQLMAVNNFIYDLIDPDWTIETEEDKRDFLEAFSTDDEGVDINTIMRELEIENR